MHQGRCESPIMVDVAVNCAELLVTNPSAPDTANTFASSGSTTIGGAKPRISTCIAAVIRKTTDSHPLMP